MNGLKKTVTCILIITVAASCMLGCSLFSGGKKSGDILPHLIAESEAEENPVRRIDSVTETRGFEQNSLSEQYNELNDILYSGCKPDFTTAFAEVQKTYEAAKEVLNRYILNGFTNYERVHAIHDWLTYYTEYDDELLYNASTAQSGNPSFSPAGVFNKHKAVCDGFAKAFALMCGIEQIRCIRITGNYVSEQGTVAHAWNKVNIDGTWYNVDCTMDAWHVDVDGKTRVNIINHGYFLLSDDDMRDDVTGRHTESGDDPVNYDCDSSFAFHEVTALGIGNYTMKITDQSSLNDVFTRIKQSKRKIGKVELQLEFPDYDKSNLYRRDAYLSQITEAFKKVNDADFALSPSENVYPYQRYPNGVFVFLIYR